VSGEQLDLFSAQVEPGPVPTPTPTPTPEPSAVAAAPAVAVALPEPAAPALADQAARDEATSRIDTSFVVSAGAGAGKTRTLIQRLEQVLDRGGDPARIVAITFTERAARDLVDKLRAQLPEPLVPMVESMSVGTIHAFCLGILRRHPLEAGLPPVFSTQDELLSRSDAHDRALRLHRRFFEAVHDLDDPEVRDAIDVLVEENGLYHLGSLVELVDRQWDRFDELQLVEPAPWRSTFRAALAPVRELTADPDVPATLRAKLVTLADTVDRCLAAESPAGALGSLPRRAGLGNTGGTAGKPWRDRAQGCLDAARTAIHDTVVRRLLGILVPLVLAEAHDRYRNGNVSFDDILVLTRRLLARHDTVRRRLRGEIDHLCVDEFQDTDAVQYDIVQALTAPGEEGGATPVLFAVGDPKQSIYGFREAEVALFEQLHELPHVTRLELFTNFRSRPGVLRWVNEVFERWFAADAADGQVPFRPLDHHVADAPAVVTVIGGAIDAPAGQVARAQARDLARTITAAHGTWQVRDRAADAAPGASPTRPARYADIAVLVRTRADLLHLEPALRRAGVPYVIEGGALLYDTREVRDLIRVLAAVNDTASRIKVVTALRTSVLAVSDTELVAHREAGGSWSLDAPADRPGHPAVVAALAALRRWAEARHRIAPPELLDLLARRSLSRAASLVDGAHTTTWRRLRLVLDEARWWFEQTGGSLGEYLAWIASRIDADDRSNVTTDETDEDAVHVLTVHAAKGLEFPIVMVSGMGRPRPVGDHVRVAFVTDEHGRTSYGLKLGKLCTTGIAASADDAVQRLEAARLTYVACTRAEDHLVLCLHRSAKASRNAAAECAPHLPDDREDLVLRPAPVVPTAAVTPLDDRVDRPPPRASVWRVRSSWSATQLRHRDDDAPVSVPPVPTPVAAPGDRRAPGDTAADHGRVDDGPATDRDGAAADAAGPSSAAAGPSAAAAGPNSAAAGPSAADAGAAADDGGDGPGGAAGGRTESVHSKPPRPFAALPDQIGRYGTRVGRAVHGAVQVLPFHDPGPLVEAVVAQQCRAEEVPDRLVPYVERLVASILASEAWARMRRAAGVGTVRREMYVGAEVDGEGVYGIIDAVWLEHGRFVVVDFKTDHVLETPVVLAQRYRPQLAAYAAALRAATGRDVAETVLCVARPDGSPAATVPIAV
jgi:ATP-dependent exoDNAse (exonuclease V) beta subunit